MFNRAEGFGRALVAQGCRRQHVDRRHAVEAGSAGGSRAGHDDVLLRLIGGGRCLRARGRLACGGLGDGGACEKRSESCTAEQDVAVSHRQSPFSHEGRYQIPATGGRSRRSSFPSQQSRVGGDPMFHMGCRSGNAQPLMPATAAIKILRVADPQHCSAVSVASCRWRGGPGRFRQWAGNRQEKGVPSITADMIGPVA
jgi:hypothetical protein